MMLSIVAPAWSEGVDVTEETPWQESYRLEGLGKFERAIAPLNFVLLDSPDHEFALMRRAALKYALGWFADSILDYRKALEINPHSLETRHGIVRSLIAQQRWREASVEAQKIIQLSNWDYTAHLQIMICDEAQRKWTPLQQRATQLAAHYPTDATALIYLARAEAWLGDVPKANAAYARVLELFPVHAEASNYINSNFIAK
ncbi:MAG: hypothetical protein WC742_11130 [Gallionellaceae bacterium]